MRLELEVQKYYTKSRTKRKYMLKLKQRLYLDNINMMAT